MEVLRLDAFCLFALSNVLVAGGLFPLGGLVRGMVVAGELFELPDAVCLLLPEHFEHFVVGQEAGAVVQGLRGVRRESAAVGGALGHDALRASMPAWLL